jgi:hypothetical protein
MITSALLTTAILLSHDQCGLAMVLVTLEIEYIRQVHVRAMFDNNAYT